MAEDAHDSPAHKDVKLYTRFPKDWTPKEIYEYLIGRAEEDGKARDGESGGAEKKNET